MTNPTRTPAELVALLDAFPDELARVIFANEEDDPESLMRPASDGGWGVVEILPHLRDWEEIYFERLSKMAAETAPYLPGFDDSLWSIERDYRGQDPHETYDDLRALRGRTVELLRSLPAEGWQRTGEHGYYGAVTIQWLADHIADHDQEHLRQAKDALAA